MRIEMRHISIFLVQLCLGGLLLSLSGCIEAVELASSEIEAELVISGSISSGIATHQVEIFVSSPFGDAVPDYVGGASVAVVDELGVSYPFTEGETGRYSWKNENRPIAVGESFYLQIVLDDGREYRSAVERVPSSIPIQNAYFEIKTDVITNELGFPLENKFLDVFVDIELPSREESSLLRWETERVYVFQEVDWPKPPCDPRRFPRTCYVFEGKTQPQEVILLDGDELQVGPVEGIWVGRKRLDSTFNQLSVFTVVQKSSSRTSFNYWQDVATISSEGGSIFDAPPAPVRGNIVNANDEREQVLGNFEAVNVDTARVIIFPTDLDQNFVPPYCQPVRFRPCEYYAPCLFCQLIPNSTLERPDYLP
ncbi:MAG: DUF4249 domain-containing protein [Bacteroidota bacterium]